MDAQQQQRLEARLADAIGVLRGDTAPDDIFTAGFLADVPPAQLEVFRRQLSEQLGSILRVERLEPQSPDVVEFTLRFERATGSGTLQIDRDDDDRISGLSISSIQPLIHDPVGLIERLDALPGEAGLLIARLGADGTIEPQLAHRANERLAIGSAFKLYVLAALARSVERGEHSWDEVVPLTVQTFSGARLNHFPDGAPLTIQTLATLMISESDNRATDQLMALLGRQAIEAELIASGHSDPDSTVPMLSTAQLYALKADDELATLYAGLGEDEQAEVLAQLDLSGVPTADINGFFGAGPRSIDIEWFASAEDIARIFAVLRDLGDPVVIDILAVNPALPDAERDRWTYAGYKGGSEPGVLNLSWLLLTPDGQWYAIILTQNDPASAFSSQPLELLGLEAVTLARSE